MGQVNHIQPQQIILKSFKGRGYSFYLWILLVCILTFVAYVRIRLLSTPIERDEGEYAYMGQLLLQGVPPYGEASNMKLPGTSIMYAFFMFMFGETVSAIHTGLLLINISSIVLLFLLTRRWLSPQAGIIASVSFALLTLNPALLGFAAHATHFVVFFALGGLFMLLIALEHKKLRWFFLSGILLGCAFLMKQPGVFFLLLGLSILIYFRFTGSLFQKDFLRSSIFLSAGFFLPLFTILIVIVCSGAWNKFWFWVIQYAFEYGSLVSISDGMVSLHERMRVLWDFFPWLCLLTGAGFVLVVTGRFQKNTIAMLLLFGFYSVLALLPGWNFRSHYFILILPACSMLIGSGYLYICNALIHRSGWKYVPVLFYAVVIAQNIYTFRNYYFTLAPVDVVRLNYTDNFFSESIPISSFLADHTTPSDRIAILGSEPQIFFYARRRSASSHIYMYGMMEPQPYARKMQEEFISDVESILPKYLLFFRIGTSWLVKTNSDMHIIHWLKEYTEQHYHPVGIVDLIDLYDVRYKWGSETLGYTPISENAIFIFERIDSNR